MGEVCDKPGRGLWEVWERSMRSQGGVCEKSGRGPLEVMERSVRSLGEVRQKSRRGLWEVQEQSVRSLTGFCGMFCVGFLVCILGQCTRRSSCVNACSIVKESTLFLLGGTPVLASCILPERYLRPEPGVPSGKDLETEAGVPMERTWDQRLVSLWMDDWSAEFLNTCNVKWLMHLTFESFYWFFGLPHSLLTVLLLHKHRLSC